MKKPTQYPEAASAKEISSVKQLDPATCTKPMKSRKEITHKKKLILQRDLEKLIHVLVFLIFYHFSQTMKKN